MIRVLSAFCAEEFPRQAITDKGYELLKEASYSVKQKYVNNKNQTLNHTIFKFKVASEGNQNLDEIVQTSLADNLMRKLHDICEIRLLPKEKFFTFADDTESQYDGTFESEFE